MDRNEARRLYDQLAAERDRAREEFAAVAARLDGLTTALDGLLKAFPGIDHESSGEDEEKESAFRRFALAAVAALTTTQTSYSLQALGPRSISEALEIIFRQDNGDTWFTTSDLVIELDTRGWLGESSDPDAAVRAALRRLRDRGVVRCQQIDGDGRALQYTLKVRSEDGPEALAQSGSVPQLPPALQSAARRRLEDFFPAGRGSWGVHR